MHMRYFSRHSRRLYHARGLCGFPQLAAVTRASSPPSNMTVITRRHAILTGLGLPGLLKVVPATAFASQQFWNETKPSDWTDAEIHQLLNQSPWAKEGSINDTTRRGSLGSPEAERGGTGVGVGGRRP